MRQFEVVMGRKGSGGGTFKVYVSAATPDEARIVAQHQQPGYVAHAVRSIA